MFTAIFDNRFFDFQLKRNASRLFFNPTGDFRAFFRVEGRRFDFDDLVNRI